MNWIVQKAKDIWSWGRGWLSSMTPRKRKGTIIIGALTVGASIFGGTVFTMAGAAFLSNAVFWALIHDSKPIMGFMTQFGFVVDVALTVGSFFMLGGTLGAFLISLMTTAYFTGFRLVLLEESALSFKEYLKNMWPKKKVVKVELLGAPSAQKVDGGDVKEVAA